MSDRLGRRDQAVLVQLADGTRTGAARRRAEARLRAIPDGERLLERQRRVARALGAGAEPPPLHSPRSPRPGLRLVTAGALAAVLAVLLLLVSQEPRPSAERAADIAQLPATDPAPEASGPVLRMQVEARIVERDGLRMSVYRDPDHGGHDGAVFEREGRTCVVAGHVIELSTLLERAAWDADGAVRS